jgi:ribose transport system ATP-binding protein
MPLLQASGMRKRFGGVVALDGAEFSLEPGEVHALIGANGCGKSTLCKILAGAVDADAGALTLDGRTVAFANPAQAAAAGIELFYQEQSLIPAMTVAENIGLGREPRTRFGFVDRAALRSRAEAALIEFGEAIGAYVDPDAPVLDLSADQRQVIEILKVLGTEARIVILDEATASLDRHQVDSVFRHVAALRERGRSVIFISHRIGEVFAVADRITIMRNGVTVATRSARATSQDEIVSLMIGAEATKRTWQRRHQPRDETALSVDNLGTGKLRGISLAVRRGEILGLGGLHGQGQSELLRALYGVVPIRTGTVRVGGTPLDPAGPRVAMRRSIAYISGDRARDGVMANRPIFENLVLSLLARNRRRTVSPARLRREIAPIIGRMKLKFSSLSAPVSELSGGNQQKVVLGRSLVLQPAILLLDDPTKGIDLGTKDDLYVTMDEACEQGISILLHSSDDKELLALSDRVLVFNGGQITGELAGSDRNEAALYRAAYASDGANASFPTPARPMTATQPPS